MGHTVSSLKLEQCLCKIQCLCKVVYFFGTPGKFQNLFHNRKIRASAHQKSLFKLARHESDPLFSGLRIFYCQRSTARIYSKFAFRIYSSSSGTSVFRTRVSNTQGGKINHWNYGNFESWKVMSPKISLKGIKKLFKIGRVRI